MEALKVLLVIAAAAWMSVGVIRRAWQLWRNEARDLDGFPRWFRRAVPSLALWFPLCWWLGAVAMVLGHFNGESPLEHTLIGIGACVWLIGMPLTVSVALFGRPAALIPPALRRRRHPKRNYDGPSLAGVTRVLMLWATAFAATLIVMQWVG